MDSGEMNLLSGKSERGGGHVILYIFISFSQSVSSHAIVTLLLVIFKPKLKLAHYLTSWVQFRCSKCFSTLNSRFTVWRRNGSIHFYRIEGEYVFAK
ncbi:hypothetical protein NA56DRAFT_17623 [Hyaloscypha hepaticicola]|jgi:hypothetical protein|uniref:Uncharacterized protein n=1 Tax=Hyaloscypha hepaticicola TaxID=2082293 RepID=A0A2J6QQN7_9HELO|nr:hypothetical protein NA56DRAFT_17623 [Hyaloscypha hepaticicola]